MGGSTIAFVALVAALAAASAWQTGLVIDTEQQTQATHQRVTDAQLLTRSAMAWAVALLNSPVRRGGQCERNDQARWRFAQAHDLSAPPPITCGPSLPLGCACPALATQSLPTPGPSGVSVQLTPDTTTPQKRWSVVAQSDGQRVSALLASHPLLREQPPPCEAGPSIDSWFHLPPVWWAALPQVKRLHCPPEQPCDQTLGEALAAGWQLFHFPQGLSLVGRAQALTLGQADAPVLLVVEGPMALPANSAVIGAVVLGQGARPQDVPADLTLTGALMACGANQTTPGPASEQDHAVMAQLRAQAQWVAIVPGTWNDRP